MKKIALGLLSLFLIVGTINAQEGKKALKKGSKMLNKYGTNAIDNADQLDEGLMLIEKAFENEDVKGQAKNYVALGEAYSAVVSGQINAKLLDETYEITQHKLGLKAMDAFVKAHSMAEKKGDKKDAVAGLQAVESHLNNVAIYYFQVNDYANAFDYFNGAVKAYESLKEFGGDSRLDLEADRMDHYFYTAAAGYYGQKGEAVIPVLEYLVENNTDKGLVYEALYNIYSKTDATKAVSYLNKGREMFPDDTGLLFAEINYYLVEGKLEVLIDKLKAAQAKEPDNVTIVTTLGNVFDQLNVQERTAGNFDKADEYFAEAFKYYGEAIAKDPSNFDAVYSQGALYYNKAASYTDRINELANDFSAAGTKKYNDLKAEMDGFFDEAMPFFLKANEMKPDDLNTLIALKEIHARKDQLDVANEYKAKIEALQAGGGQ
ncbi:MAG: hypothetical protein P1U56_10910 [Saprospiraceae bacterium]|nr:hypothetical protein [Saprospiraceae bacterium]